MFSSLDQFAKAWHREAEITQTVLDTLTDSSLEQSIGEGRRTLGRLAWHLTQTVPEMLNRTGLQVKGPEHDEPVPREAAAITRAYAEASDSALREVTSSWNDDSLIVRDEMYGEQWPRSETLWVLVVHQVHHRGQMTVLMRQSGLKVPRFYGPVLEDWPTFGIPEPVI